MSTSRITHSSGRQVFRLTLLAVLGFLSGSGCLTPTRPPVELEQAASIKPRHIRDIRVLLGSDKERVRVRVDGAYRIISGNRTVESGPRLANTEIRCSPRGTVVFGAKDTGLQAVDVTAIAVGTIHWSPESQSGWGAPRRIAGKFRITAEPGSLISVTNSLDLETYLIGVLVGELYQDWEQQAFNAAAVVARTYALVEMGKKVRDPYDVTATEASQVYMGLPDGPGADRARRAAEATRGVVCAWNSPAGKRIFPTYYSSACGGATQAAGNFKTESNLPPLRGGVACDYCRIAKGEAYRWKPVRIAKTTLLASLARRDPTFTSFSAIARVEAADQTSDGRLVRVRVVGSNGEARTMVAEDFRLAVGSRTMRSTACRIVDEGKNVLFTEGKGFGHGMGLCQWGTQGQALAGRTASQILRFYYPGAELIRAY